MKTPLASLLLLSSPLHSATLVALWEFNDSSDLAKATLGTDLTLNGTVAATTGAVSGDGAANFLINSWALATNPIGPNGATGTPTRTNQFTLVLDFMVPSLNTYTALFDFNNKNTEDADYYIKSTSVGGFGLNSSSVGMSYQGGHTAAAANTWYRLVVTSDVGVGRSAYLNGVLLGNYANGTQDVDRISLESTFRISWDNDGEDSIINISNLALFDGRMTPSEVNALGSAGMAIPEPSIVLLGGMGLLGLFGRRRSRN